MQAGDYENSKASPATVPMSIYDRVGNVLSVENLGPRWLTILLDGLLIRRHAKELRRRVAWLDGCYPEPSAGRLDTKALKRGLDKELARRVDSKAREHLSASVR
ncbi:uncharacterized protein PgNI_00777 [Pyricularia grisea]|uniref:Uncharacterized protein n=1 Tax=Pyricularia grisea TaxID=148305 RepID=A0A6P8BJR0_PYRGI|nr:uncharacterized protein PgNI_00777 [Pyricularia grisea]TLD16817.1 hypothetical protein PgNI_00777 [Pyricularia grisea]